MLLPLLLLQICSNGLLSGEPVSPHPLRPNLAFPGEQPKVRVAETTDGRCLFERDESLLQQTAPGLFSCRTEAEYRRCLFRCIPNPVSDRSSLGLPPECSFAFTQHTLFALDLLLIIRRSIISDYLANYLWR